MRLSPQLLSLVAGTAAVASLGSLAIGCTESRASASAPAQKALLAPAITPVAVTPVMRPIDFEAPEPSLPMTVSTDEGVVVATAEPTLTNSEVASEIEPESTSQPRQARRPRAQPTPPDPGTIGDPNWLAAAACGRG
jgi:hypothetical protein